MWPPLQDTADKNLASAGGRGIDNTSFEGTRLEDSTLLGVEEPNRQFQIQRRLLEAQRLGFSPQLLDPPKERSIC